MEPNFELLILEAYRESRIGDAEAAATLGLSRLEWNHLLKAKHITENAYTVDDLDRDVATIHRLRAAGSLPAA
jgi:predicted HTH domain antitoxin